MIWRTKSGLGILKWIMIGKDKVLSKYAGKSVVVTGAGGYLGSALTAALFPVATTIYRVSRSLRHLAPPGTTKANIEDIEADLRDIDSWKGLCSNADIIFHLSSQTNVYTAWEDPETDWRINVLPVLNMLETCHRLERKPFIVLTGTATEVGLTEGFPVNEKVKDNPVTIYDAHKLAAENYIKTYCANNYAAGTVLRLSNVYGSGSSMNKGRGFINFMVRKALKGEPLTIYGDGEYIRDYIYKDDVINALLRCLPMSNALNGRDFIIGSGFGLTLKEAVYKIASKAEKITGKVVAVEHVSVPEGLSPIEYRNFIADTSAFRTASGWHTEYDFDSGLEKLFKDIQKGM